MLPGARRGNATSPIRGEEVLNPQGKRRRVDRQGGCQGPENRRLETHRQAQPPHGAGEVQTALSPSPEKGDSETDDASEKGDNSARRPRNVANLLLGAVPGVDELGQRPGQVPPQPQQHQKLHDASAHTVYPTGSADPPQ